MTSKQAMISGIGPRSMIGYCKSRKSMVSSNSMALFLTVYLETFDQAGTIVMLLAAGDNHST